MCAHLEEVCAHLGEVVRPFAKVLAHPREVFAHLGQVVRHQEEKGAHRTKRGAHGRGLMAVLGGKMTRQDEKSAVFAPTGVVSYRRHAAAGRLRAIKAVVRGLILFFPPPKREATPLEYLFGFDKADSLTEISGQSGSVPKLIYPYYV